LCSWDHLICYLFALCCMLLNFWVHFQHLALLFRYLSSCHLMCSHSHLSSVCYLHLAVWFHIIIVVIIVIDVDQVICVATYLLHCCWISLTGVVCGLHTLIEKPFARF
jgi:hypothetical protein